MRVRSNSIPNFSALIGIDLPIDRIAVFWHSLFPMKQILSLLLLAIVITGLSACNTISGAGRDVSALGHDVSAGANAVQSKIQN
jgi:predicted small secreted protein